MGCNKVDNGERVLKNDVAKRADSCGILEEQYKEGREGMNDILSAK